MFSAKVLRQTQDPQFPVPYTDTVKQTGVPFPVFFLSLCNFSDQTSLYKLE